MSFLEDLPELPKWEPQPDWLNVGDLRAGDVLVYETGEFRHSILVLAPEPSGFLHGKSLPRIEVETRKKGDDEVVDEAWGLLMGVSQNGAGGEVVQRIPPSEGRFARVPEVPEDVPL